MFHGTTILCVRRDGHVVMAGDGQVTLEKTVMKASARKVRRLADGSVLAGFAGSTSDAFTLFERFEAKLKDHQKNLARACVELGKDWRTDRFLRRLEALLLVADADKTYVLSGSGDVVEPDLLFVTADQQGILTETNVQGPPALVIEIASPSTRRRDEGIKQRLFDRGGVREYWLVDPDRNRVRVWRRQQDGTFARVAELSREEQLTTPLMPQLTIRLTQLFA